MDQTRHIKTDERKSDVTTRGDEPAVGDVAQTVLKYILKRSLSYPHNLPQRFLKKRSSEEEGTSRTRESASIDSKVSALLAMRRTRCHGPDGDAKFHQEFRVPPAVVLSRDPRQRVKQTCQQGSKPIYKHADEPPPVLKVFILYNVQK